MITPVWISLGSNLGDRHAILDAALNLLHQSPGVIVTQVSSYHETLPVGGPMGQGAFLNAAARLETTLSPRELLGVTQGIEDQLGRVRTVRWGERTLDLDLLIFGGKFVDEPDLKLPHPRLAVRRFVLEPLAEIAPQIVDTITRRTIADLIESLQKVPRLIMLTNVDAPSDADWARRIAAGLSGLSILRSQIPPLAERSLAEHGRMDRDRREILRRLDQIQATIRRSDPPSCEWFIADYWLDIRSLKQIALRHPDSSLGESLDSFRPGRQWKAVLRRHLRQIPDPVFVVALPGSARIWRPNLFSSPTYWPEATDPAAIIAEIVAVCRGIAAV